MNVFAEKLYRLKQDKCATWSAISLILLFGLQCANSLLLKQLGLSNAAWPWSFIEVINKGFLLPTLIAFGMVYAPIVAGVYWFAGGIKRAIVQQIFFIGAYFYR